MAVRPAHHEWIYPACLRICPASSRFIGLTVVLSGLTEANSATYNGCLWAKPWSVSCQNSIRSSPRIQHR